MNSLILKALKGEIIVSCQAEKDDPFNKPEYIALFAKAAQMGGAKCVRSEGIDNILAIKRIVDLPIIGLVKDTYEDGFVKITGSFKDVEKLVKINCDIIAIDGTFRVRDGLTGPDFIYQIKQKNNCLVLADISTVEEAIASVEAGADCVATTLSGYTPETQNKNLHPDFELIKILSKKVRVPIFAEGRIKTPMEAKKAIEMGAYSIVIGSAITRPRLITSWFVTSLNSHQK